MFLIYSNASAQPTLTSTIQSKIQWDSYSQWMCFRRQQVKPHCTIYDKTILVPSIRVESNERVLYFDLHVGDSDNCKSTLSEWTVLIKNSPEICIFGAYMPGVDMGEDPKSGKPNSLWYIEKIKTKNGEWTIP